MSAGNSPGGNPTAAEVADRLGIKRQRLLQFVDYHPDPTPQSVLGLATTDPAHEDTIATWLDSYERATVGAIGEDDDLDVDDNRRGVLVR